MNFEYVLLILITLAFLGVRYLVVTLYSLLKVQILQIIVIENTQLQLKFEILTSIAIIG